ncbi:unnamed protein product [Acanthoscelides obtectus]|uniref:Uncharacterized protein n=1 Tax=Acanthoscelides obtectus TaxID=200917 RepID=A0A9P0KLG8_ACAOB|nr:unnamed protein product [Acanthoscelides obtectus]CAK1631862.1 hypothetical protein AOBTE_LOCUS7212 [Acanthoscelides obtectus]
MMSESARFCNSFVKFIILAYALVGVSAHISALWRLNTEQEGTYFQENSTCYDFLPYMYMIPFDVGSIGSCKFALFFMDFCFCIIASYISGSTGTSIEYLASLCCSNVSHQCLLRHRTFLWHQ